MRFRPNPPRPGTTGVTHIKCLESNPNMGPQAERFAVECCVIRFDSKAQKWVRNVKEGNMIHENGRVLIDNKVAALNAKKPKIEGGDPNAEELWQDSVGLVWQDGVTHHELITAKAK